MALTVRDISSANVVVAELDRITQALVALGGRNPKISVEISADGVAATQVSLPVNPATLTMLLTNRQTMLQNQLTVLGINL